MEGKQRTGALVFFWGCCNDLYTCWWSLGASLLSIHSFNKHVLKTRSLPNTKWGTGNTMQNKANSLLTSLCRWFSGWREALGDDNKISCASVGRGMWNPTRTCQKNLTWSKLWGQSLPWLSPPPRRKRSGNPRAFLCSFSSLLCTAPLSIVSYFQLLKIWKRKLTQEPFESVDKWIVFSRNHQRETGRC